MAWISDGEKITQLRNYGPSYFAAGWLSLKHQYLKEKASPELIDALKRCATRSTNAQRGFHLCEFCPADFSRIEVQYRGRRISLGSAELHIKIDSEKIIVAPNLIAHYVECHQYKPPDNFSAAAIDFGDSIPVVSGAAFNAILDMAPTERILMAVLLINDIICDHAIIALAKGLRTSGSEAKLNKKCMQISALINQAVVNNEKLRWMASPLSSLLAMGGMIEKSEEWIASTAERAIELGAGSKMATIAGIPTGRFKEECFAKC